MTDYDLYEYTEEAAMAYHQLVSDGYSKEEARFIMIAAALLKLSKER